MYMTKDSIMQRLKEHYEIASQEGELFAIFLQGSQNYIEDRFFENSDVDSRAVYLPPKRELFLGVDISKPEKILDNDEHIDRFDIRKFLTLIKKPGINNYENLFTEYVIVNPKYKDIYEELIELREDLVRSNEKNFVMSLMGISIRDYKNLESRTGNQDSDIQRYGYSRKRLANILRFNKTIKAYLAKKPFTECMKSLDQDLLYKIRRTDFYSLEDARKLAEQADIETGKLAKQFYGEPNFKSHDLVDALFVKLMERSLQK